MKTASRWSSEDARQCYRIAEWGQGYFNINEKGHVAAFPQGAKGPSIDIHQLLNHALGQGLHLPLLVRFSDVLRHRLSTLRAAFAQAMSRHGYEGGYTCVFPVKVNPQRQVVEEIIAAGQVGLEAGSRPELLAVLALLEGPGGMIICNGRKDDAYIRLALQANRLGPPVFLVAEKYVELERIVVLARSEGVMPRLGIRIRLMSNGSGKWEDSGGDRSKFGLTSTELLSALDLLRETGFWGQLELVHFHLGSQLSNLASLTEALREMGRYYAELRTVGCPLRHVDVGGGLGVDYEGRQGTEGFGINYTEQEYAHAVVATLAKVCGEAGVPQPHLISESGRALTAHHAMVVVDVFEGAARPYRSPRSSRSPRSPRSGEEDALVLKMRHCLAGLDQHTFRRCWQETQRLREEGKQGFVQGTLSLEARAGLETLFWRIARRTERLMRTLHPPPLELRELEALLADLYFCNFSVFQSLPDAWAIGQSFPVMPLHRLNQAPTRRGILQDITCDSDGQIAQYIGAPRDTHVLPLHTLRKNEPYYLGIFLTGAYQEILGEQHNLFGDSDGLHVRLSEDGSWRCTEMTRGERARDVLARVQYEAAGLEARMAERIQAAVSAGRIPAADGQRLARLYGEGLNLLPYLEPASAGLLRENARPHPGHPAAPSSPASPAASQVLRTSRPVVWGAASTPEDPPTEPPVTRGSS